MKFSLLALAILILVNLMFITPIKKTKAETDNNLIIVELFTSQSCSSCPPADKVLSELEKNPNIITLSCNVTYWNHLHWKDTLSQQFCTDRQRKYAAVKQRGRVYTPQMVVNGSYEFVGSNRKQALNIINKAQSDNIKPISIQKHNDKWVIQLPNMQWTGDYIITAFTSIEGYTQNIPSGENKGRTVHYTNPIIGKINLGAWDGSAKAITLSASQGNLTVLAQNKTYKTIAAAGKL